MSPYGGRQRHDPRAHRGEDRCRQQDHDHRRRARRADQEQQPRRPAQRAQGPAVAYDVADQQIVSGKIGSEAYLAAVSEQPVTLNPRFGVLDPTQKTIITDQVGVPGRAGAHPDAMPVPLPELERLVSVMARLRQECPWDAQQTHRSLVQYLVEETAETVEAIEVGRPRSSSRGAR